MTDELQEPERPRRARPLRADPVEATREAPPSPPPVAPPPPADELSAAAGDRPYYEREAPTGSPRAAAPPGGFCPACGIPADIDARWCSGCGAALRSPDGAPEAAPPRAAAAPLPAWLTADWLLAAAVALVTLVGAAVVGAIFGLAVGLVNEGFSTNALLATLSGVWLPFAALGSNTLVALSNGDQGVLWGTAAVMPVPLFGLALSVRGLVRRASARTAQLPAVQIALAVKVALLFAVAIGIAASVLGIGDFDADNDSSGFNVVSTVSIAKCVIWGFLVVFAAAVSLVPASRWARSAWTPRLKRAQAVAVGAAAWFALIVFLGGIVSVVGVANANGTEERLSAAALAPLGVGNAGVVASSVALGGSVAIPQGASLGDIDSLDEAQTDSHVSLLQFGLTRGSDEAPIWAWPILVLPPLFAGVATFLWFRRRSVNGASGILLEAVGVAGGFVVTAWAGAMFAPSLAAAFIGGEEFVGLSRVAVARPAVPSTFGLALLAALVGVAIAASLAARRQGISLLEATSSLPAFSYCPTCGARAVGRVQFCANCGASLAASTAPSNVVREEQ